MNDQVDPLLRMVAKTASMTDGQLTDLPLDAERDRLFDQIVSSASFRRPDRRGRWVPRPLFRSATVGLATGAILLIASLVLSQSVVSTPEAKAAGVRFATQGGYIDAAIDDPSAPAASMEAAFAEHGLDVAVDVVPSSPGLVGTITFIGNSRFEPIYDPERYCPQPGGGARCIIGLRVPSDFPGSWDIVVNGTAGPGDVYHSTQDALAPGEVLHCTGVRGMTVAQAMPILEELSVTVIWPEGVSQASVQNQFIAGTDPVSPGTVSLYVQPRPPSQDDGNTAYYDALDQGC